MGDKALPHASPGEESEAAEQLLPEHDVVVANVDRLNDMTQQVDATDSLKAEGAAPFGSADVGTETELASSTALAELPDALSGGDAEPYMFDTLTEEQISADTLGLASGGGDSLTYDSMGGEEQFETDARGGDNDYLSIDAIDAADFGGVDDYSGYGGGGFDDYYGYGGDSYCYGYTDAQFAAAYEYELAM